jgi:hypothetical protein
MDQEGIIRQFGKESVKAGNAPRQSQYSTHKILTDAEFCLPRAVTRLDHDRSELRVVGYKIKPG